MDFGKAFTFQFEQEDWWKKLLLTGLIALIPIVGILYVIGWMMEIAGRFAKASAGESVALPDVDFGGFLGKGFQGFIVSLVYALPSVLFVLPILIVTIFTASDGGDTANMVLIITSICCGGLALLLAIAGGLLTYPALVEVQVQGNLKAGFNFKRVFAIFKNAIVPYLLSILAMAIITPILSSLGGLLCGFGILLTVPYSVSLTGYFLGSAYKEGVSSLEPQY